MNYPLVTIGITSFNALNSIECAINSATSQSWKNFEIIVVDDCSTDGTFEFVQKLSAHNKTIRLFRNSVNSGVAVSRNRIIVEAKGEFIAFFDDDDQSLPNRIYAQYRRITDYERQFAERVHVICHTARKIVYPDGKVRFHKTMGQALRAFSPYGVAVARRILLGEPLDDGYGACPTCSQMARLSTYNLIGGFDPDFRRSEDTEFNIRLALAGGHFVGIAEPLVTQKMTKTSEKSLKDEFHYMRLMLYKHRDFIDNQSVFEFSLSWLWLKQVWLENNRLSFFKMLIILLIKNPLYSMRRFIFSIPNIRLNNAFSRFHNDS